jgi:hypothetical protein
MPDRNGQWTLDFDPAYGLYWPNNPPGGRNGPVFTTAMTKSNCPRAADATFDLNYASPGTVFADPTNASQFGRGNLLMVYEGTNTCIGADASKFYSTIGIATSDDFGRSWPMYRDNFTALPDVNQTQGPMAPYGAWGGNVCPGSFCSSINLLQPPPQYGRYAISGPAISVTEAIQLLPGGLDTIIGDSEPAAFVDDARGDGPVYVYVTYNYNPGSLIGNTPLPDGRHTDISVSRIALNGGAARLKATHWYLNAFDEPGLARDGGGRESPIFPGANTTIVFSALASYQHCLAPTQRREAASISFSEPTNQYVLVFVCLSQSDPAAEKGAPPAAGGFRGGAWFYSTINADEYDLSHQEQWSIPNEIKGSWSAIPGSAENPCSKGEFLDGWYPSFMSIGARPGRLTAEGYVFYMNGCIDARGRTFSTRRFMIEARLGI